MTIELNKLEQVDADCRAAMIFDNGTKRTFKSFEMDLVMFDGAGVIANRMLLDIGRIRAENRPDDGGLVITLSLRAGEARAAGALRQDEA